MRRKEFAKAVAAALEVALAHPVKVDNDIWLSQTVIHALDQDQVLWRISIETPQ